MERKAKTNKPEDLLMGRKAIKEIVDRWKADPSPMVPKEEAVEMGIQAYYQALYGDVQQRCAAKRVPTEKMAEFVADTRWTFRNVEIEDRCKDWEEAYKTKEAELADDPIWQENERIMDNIMKNRFASLEQEDR